MLEKYVRDETHCGLKQCTCFGAEFEDHRIDPLGNSVQNKVMKLPHVVLVDSTTLLKFIDIFVDGKIQ